MSYQNPLPELTEEQRERLAEEELRLRMENFPKQRQVYGENEFGIWGWMWI